MLILGYNHIMAGVLRKSLGVFAGLGVLFAFIFSISFLPAAAQSDTRYFPDTGHTVSGDFLAFYERAPDPKLLYGNPITEAFIDPFYGRLMQYFENVRFELYPDQPAGSRVQITPLGEYIYTPSQVTQLTPLKSSNCQTFKSDQDSFEVCFAFLDFFKAYGGVAQFGYPISNVVIERGLRVQYFQKARFEWRNWLAAGQKVRLSGLGRTYFEQQAIDKSYLRQGNNLPQQVNRLRVRAYADQVITGLQGSQVVNVQVLDQNWLPVADAEVTLQVIQPSGEALSAPQKLRTGPDGLAHLSFTYHSDRPGMFALLVTAHWGELDAQTSSSFRAWY
jgi:hypothetical protein